jgi:PAS domain S-box-containing protein
MAVALKEGQPVLGEEIVIERPDETRSNVLPHPEPIRDGSGAIVGAINTLVDITDLKRADQALRVSEERLRLVACASNEVIWEIDLTKDGVWWSEAMESVFGYALEHIAPHTSWYHEQIHPDDRGRVIQGMAEVIKSEHSLWSEEFRYRRADGSYAYVVQRAHLVRTSTGKAVRMIGAMRDITARKQAEEVSARLAAIVDSSHDAIVGKTLEGIITSWNSAAESVFGYTAAEAVGQHISLIIPEERKAEEEDVLARLRRGDRIDNFETQRQTKDGRKIQIALTISPIRDGAGRIIGASKIARDITGRKQAEEKLAYQQQLLQTITDNAQTSIFMMDTEGRGTFVNPAVEKMTGYRKEELIGHFLHGILHHTHPDRSPYPIIECPIHRILPLTEPVRGHEDAFVRKDGTFIPVRCNARPIFKNEIPVGTIIEVWDITLEKWAEQALRESEAHFRTMADNVPAMLWVTEPTGRCTYLSKQWYEYTGNAPEQSLELGCLKNVHPDDMQRVSDTFLKANEQHLPFNVDYRLRRQDGWYRWVLDAGLPRFDPAGRFEGYVGCVIDVHDRKVYEQALTEARKTAEAANVSKSEFLANMSHEIRSPMTGILGYADILLSHLQDPDDIECVKTIKQSGNYLLELINDILDLSKIEAGELKVTREPISLPTLLTEVHSLMTVRAKEKQLSVILNYQGAIPESVESDRTRLRQILINLVSNAIKFTENGSVQIISKFFPSESALQIEVVDSGIGISREQQTKLFQPFTQGDSSATREYGGTGLGLAITKRLVEMLGGSISFESEQNKGSTFRVMIPVKVLNATPTDPAAVWSVPDVPLDCRVLVVDDRREIRDLVRHFIEDAGGWVIVAPNGQAAIEAIERSEANGQPLDIVIMDIQMPGLDGYEATRRLRAKGFKKPIIGLTAGAMKGDREKCLEAGCDNYLSKPIDRRALVELIARYAGAFSGDGKKDGYPKFSENPKLKILLVDDSRIACRSTAVLLEMSGHEVRTAYDGQSALAVAQDFSADVAILDIKLPDTDGYGLVKRLKQLNGFRDAKFIALTGYGEEAARKDEAVDFHHFVRKPVETTLLESLLEKRAI